MKNQSINRHWYFAVGALIGCSLIASTAEARPKVKYTVENSIEIKQSGNGWARPNREYIPVDPHTKAVQKAEPPRKKGEYEVHIVYPTKGPLAIRVPPQDASGRGRLLNSVQSNAGSASGAKKESRDNISSSSTDRTKGKTTVSNTVRKPLNETAATYEENYGQPRKRKY